MTRHHRHRHGADRADGCVQALVQVIRRFAVPRPLARRGGDLEVLEPGDERVVPLGVATRWWRKRLARTVELLVAWDGDGWLPDEAPGAVIARVEAAPVLSRAPRHARVRPVQTCSTRSEDGDLEGKDAVPM